MWINKRKEILAGNWKTLIHITNLLNIIRLFRIRASKAHRILSEKPAFISCKSKDQPIVEIFKYQVESIMNGNPNVQEWRERKRQ
ncbi:hypothetical protein L6452_37090 [Arctium lappa]|uniref:Uncharacterized protein n=1 Tax=Arctium lappa TaxID=4217 RepID=A0ACB8Y319_ARCLA|nr:hypothetical protein L6452_37090 [Arctium lappa]